jgi:hypothetical protein
MSFDYVQGDTKPPLRRSIAHAGKPVDLSTATVRAYVRIAGQPTIKETLVGVLSTGRLISVNDETGEWTVDTAPPYNVAGVGGIVAFNPTTTTFDVADSYELEIEIDYGAGQKQTVQKVERLRVRPQIG